MSAETLYFVQHGLAVDKKDNPDRPLSDIGIKQTQRIATYIHSADISISKIFHSGKLRARQTAEIYANSLKVPSLTAIENLSPNDDVKLIANNLDADKALYIGHLPHLENLIAYLVCNDASANIIQFQNSAIACLQKQNNRYQLKWFLTSELLI